MKIDYIFPRRIFSSKKSTRAKILTEWKADLKFTAAINIKFIKCFEQMFFQLTFEDAETKHCHICFLQRPGYKL